MDFPEWWIAHEALADEALEDKALAMEALADGALEEKHLAYEALLVWLIDVRSKLEVFANGAFAYEEDFLSLEWCWPKMDTSNGRKS